MFGHTGWCERLKTWPDSKSLNDDYVPTPASDPTVLEAYAVKGVLFGVDLSTQRKKDLIAVLKTL